MSDRSPIGPDLVPVAAAPMMPVVSPDTLGRGSPQLIVSTGLRHSLGSMNAKKVGPCFVVARLSAMTIKVLERFPLTQEGWAQAWAALVKLDPGAAQAVASRLQQWADARSAIVFRWLGVQVPAGGGTVCTIGAYNSTTKTSTSRSLGPLAGAQAMVTDGSQAWSPGRAMFLPVSLAGLATKAKADAAVVFPDGTVHMSPLDGNFAVREAQKDVVRFNAMAGAAVSATPAASEGGTTLLSDCADSKNFWTLDC